MTERLRGLSILIVEDEYFVAMEVANAITCYGGSVIGPVADLEKARDLAQRETVDGVILDLKLNGETSLRFADEPGDAGDPRRRLCAITPTPAVF